MYYFQLQYKMLHRHFQAFGFPVILGYSLGMIGFIALSYLLFLKVQFAAYLYIMIGLTLISKTSKTDRNDFLKTCFPTEEYTKIRILENLILSLPFILFLVYKFEVLVIIFLIFGAVVLALIDINPKFNFTIPTPFSKTPFEFTVGFRKSYVFILFAYFIVIMAISVSNFNLGAFAFAILFFLILGYYSVPENEFFVWIFATSPAQFLRYKILMALRFTMILCLPIMILLFLFFIEKWWIIGLIPIVGFIYITAFILAKYAAFPKEMNIPQVILFVISIAFPPFLLLIIPYFYNKAIKSLRLILKLKPSN